MNITKSVIERNAENKLTKESEVKKIVGIEYYKRIIAIYPSINKTIGNIDGNNILTTARCILINYSVSKFDDNKKSKLFNKTTYICDLKFPGNITPQMLMANDISDILNIAVIEPIYAFNNPHFESLDGKFVDYGLTMVDLNSPTDYGVINFSGHNKEDQYSQFYRDIINPEFFNPKFYIPQEQELYTKNNSIKSGLLTDFIDNNTKIVKDVQNYKRNIKLFKNGFERQDRVINKRTMKTNELLLDIFSDLIFIPIEDLDMVVDISDDLTIHIKHLTTFIRFNSDANNFYYKKVAKTIEKTVNQFRNKMNGERVYITISKNEVLFSLNVIFKNKDNSVDEICITNPIHKLYSQFALNNESIVNSIEADADYAKMNYLEAAYESKDTKLLRDAIKTVNAYGNVLDSYKQELLANHYQNKEMLLDNLNQKLIEVNKREQESGDDTVF